MSGTNGVTPQKAPGRTITSLLMSQPFVEPSGQLTTWAGQFLQRLINYVGPVPSPPTGQTITEQVTDLDTLMQLSLGSDGADAATQQRVSRAEQGLTIVALPPMAAPAALSALSATPAPAAVLMPLAPLPAAPAGLMPLGALQPWLTFP
jgi:hypothetical protein